ncbi:hypothetical protein BCR39DRAFT_556874 [Naematelia encephala]|uniref:Uncharacterized protein n=1 Tax=Naematelia encephala TaxID=71784 RepID=A0A1Y2BH06_9TREE|nr:hypothetical protein BCR39DRAFT_556874 [Naematelia encephala]
MSKRTNTKYSKGPTVPSAPSAGSSAPSHPPLRWPIHIETGVSEGTYTATILGGDAWDSASGKAVSMKEYPDLVAILQKATKICSSLASRRGYNSDVYRDLCEKGLAAALPFVAVQDRPTFMRVRHRYEIAGGSYSAVPQERGIYDLGSLEKFAGSPTGSEFSNQKNGGWSWNSPSTDKPTAREIAGTALSATLLRRGISKRGGATSLGQPSSSPSSIRSFSLMSEPEPHSVNRTKARTAGS